MSEKKEKSKDFLLYRLYSINVDPYGIWMPYKLKYGVLNNLQFPYIVLYINSLLKKMAHESAVWQT